MEAYYTLGSRHIKAKDDLGKAYYHLILLARNNNGLHNLFKLSSHAYTEGLYYHPRIDDDLLGQFSTDIFATSACLGSAASQLILRGEYKQAETIIDHHARIFQDRFFLELQPHANEEQAKVNQILIALAAKKNLPLVLTADAHYTHQHQKDLHETTLKMATNSAEDGFTFGDIECFLTTHDQMASLAQAQNIPYEAIANTNYLANQIESHTYFNDIKNRWPTYKELPEGMSAWQYLEAIAWSGLEARIGYPFPEEYTERLKYEISLFKRTNLCDYLLIVAQYIQKAKDLNVLVGPGRGSVAGSLVAWAIGITEIDPVKYGLIVERFVNVGRAGTPLVF
jgi:DNA polymerase-3 subunit alpha